MHDGASVHMHPTTMQLLNQITYGHHITMQAAYSHDLSPVERGFSVVWQYIRSQWSHTYQGTPEQLINDAFFRYSVAGPMSHVAKGHWNMYQRNHEMNQ